MSDKMKKKTIIVLTKASYLSITPLLLTPTHTPPLVFLLCVCSDINIVIAYTQTIRRAEKKQRLVNATAYHIPLS